MNKKIYDMLVERSNIVVSPVPCRLHAIAFIPEDGEGHENWNLTEVIRFLGKDFIAITSGKAVSVNSITVERSNYDENAPLDSLTLVFADNVTGDIRAACRNDWIVYNPLRGYEVLTQEQFVRTYQSDDGAIDDGSLEDVVPAPVVHAEPELEPPSPRSRIGGVQTF